MIPMKPLQKKVLMIAVPVALMGVFALALRPNPLTVDTGEVTRGPLRVTAALRAMADAWGPSGSSVGQVRTSCGSPAKSPLTHVRAAVRECGGGGAGCCWRVIS